ncbi:hypothetical protein [Mycolicibacterium sp. HK-90]|nr:hypothetical protein [Mycolicibacterium sp. HK-90]WKG06316.1 hypothetical protein QU592_15095 [Mycolicibacterium sp. HK-90]
MTKTMVKIAVPKARPTPKRFDGAGALGDGGAACHGAGGIGAIGGYPGCG